MFSYFFDFYFPSSFPFVSVFSASWRHDTHLEWPPVFTTTSVHRLLLLILGLSFITVPLNSCLGYFQSSLLQTTLQVASPTDSTFGILILIIQPSISLFWIWFSLTLGLVQLIMSVTFSFNSLVCCFCASTIDFMSIPTFSPIHSSLTEDEFLIFLLCHVNSVYVLVSLHCPISSNYLCYLHVDA